VTATGIHRVLDLLRCPHCGQDLELPDRSLRCPAGHSFDVARQGYVNLLTRPVKGSHADSAAMIAARDRFLAGGHYRPLADRIARLAAEAGPGRIAEIGAGTAYYLAAVLDRLADARGIATDLSTAAGRRAAAAHDRLGSVVADTWAGLPIKDGALDLIMVVFAPRNPEEFARLLRPGGTLLVAAAGPGHLEELRAPLGLLEIEPGKQQRLVDQLGERFIPAHIETVRHRLRLDTDDLIDLVAMGPNAHHQDDRLADRVTALDPPVEVSCVVQLSTFRREPGRPAGDRC
jgi:23S rRNA (guanine745-N1)-methyltransferase